MKTTQNACDYGKKTAPFSPDYVGLHSYLIFRILMSGVNFLGLLRAKFCISPGRECRTPWGSESKSTASIASKGTALPVGAGFVSEFDTWQYPR
jgi:hypothetical protein